VVAPAADDRFQAIEVLDHEVLVGAGLIGRLGEISVRVAPAHRYAIITDDQVAPNWLAQAEQSFRTAAAPTISATIPAGEASKSREQWVSLTDWLLATGAGRDTTVIALGGGVVGDLAGFVAATYMRGVPVVQVPTSLLAMVDASVGGKTGVDTPAGKNLVGAFHQPAAVVIDPAVLATLPDAHRRAGVAEVVKHGAIADATYFRLAAAWAHDAEDAAAAGRAFDWSGPGTLGVVGRSVAIKASVVRDDPLERGRRQVLNAGHTVAHALERETGYALLHGEAVAIGLVTEAVLGERAGLTAAGTAEALRDALGSAGLPVAMPAGLDADRLLDAMRLDKKSRGGRLAFALLDRIGAMAGSDDAGWSTALDESLVRSVLSAPAPAGA
jgi:3-dehydroquinate synthase